MSPRAPSSVCSGRTVPARSRRSRILATLMKPDAGHATVVVILAIFAPIGVRRYRSMNR